MNAVMQCWITWMNVHYCPVSYPVAVCVLMHGGNVSVSIYGAKMVINMHSVRCSPYNHRMCDVNYASSMRHIAWYSSWLIDLSPGIIRWCHGTLRVSTRRLFSLLTITPAHCKFTVSCILDNRATSNDDFQWPGMLHKLIVMNFHTHLI